MSPLAQREIGLREAADARHEVGLVLVHEHLDLGAALEQLDRTGDVVTHQVAADVIRMKVGDEHRVERHVVGRELVEHRVDVPRRIDGDGAARRRVADQVDEVLHRPEEHLLEIETHRFVFPFSPRRAVVGRARRAAAGRARLRRPRSHRNSGSPFCLAIQRDSTNSRSLRRLT